ncbi:MAG: hypothetical protein MI739_08900 [Bacteroidales bacterium]|nr:hypothetical protein [Bacteroidales bacterium]
MKKSLIITLITILLAVNVKAGWIITQQIYDSDEGIEHAITKTIYLHNNVMKVVLKDISTIFDLNKETITIINQQQKIFWQGKVDTYKEEIKAEILQKMDKQLEKASEEQKEMIHKMYQNMIESIDDPAKFIGEEPDEYEIEIRKTTNKKQLVGLLAEKYNVIVNGKLKEEVWLSEQNNTCNDFNIYRFYKIFGDFINQSENDVYYHNNEKYIEFAHKGFPLESVNYFGGYETINKVIELKQQVISEGDFSIPEDYKKVKLIQLELTPIE